VTKKGDVIPAKAVVDVDCSKCVFKCSDSFTAVDRDRIKAEFWKSGDPKQQHSFLSLMVKSVPLKRRRVTADSDQPPRRNSTSEYYLRRPAEADGACGADLRVCKKFFLATLAVGERTVRGVKDKEAKKGLTAAAEDDRGKHPPVHKLSEEKLNSIKEHINSFPRMESHYCRSSSSRDYLAADLNLLRLYDLYVQKVKEEGREKDFKVCQSTFFRVFHEHFPKVSFHHPKKDGCSYCNKYSLMTEEQKAEAKSDYDLHMQCKVLSREQKERDKIEASENRETTRSFTMDLRKVFETPRTTLSLAYYTRSLSSYNFTLFDQDSMEGTCYFWTEVEGNRGSSEIGSCVYKHLLSLPETVRKVSLYSDSCGGQNRNRFMASVLLYSVRRTRLEEITLNFLETGHTDMECDSMHSAIEGRKKNLCISHPAEWCTVILNARRKSHKPYTLHQLKHRDFYNLN